MHATREANPHVRGSPDWSELFDGLPDKGAPQVVQRGVCEYACATRLAGSLSRVGRAASEADGWLDAGSDTDWRYMSATSSTALRTPIF